MKRDARTLAGETESHGLTESLPGARNEDDAILQTQIHHLPLLMITIAVVPGPVASRAMPAAAAPIPPLHSPR